MYYAPRLAPEKPGMPVLGYFTVVGGILLGLMFMADAYMPRHEHLSFVSNVDGLPAAYKGEPTHVVAAAPHISPAPAIAETTGSGFRLAGDEPKRQASLAAQPTLTAQPVVQDAVKPAPRKATRKRQREDEGLFGSNGRQDFARQDFATGFRLVPRTFVRLARAVMARLMGVRRVRAARDAAAAQRAARREQSARRATISALPR